MSINIHLMAGRITTDPELRKTTNGISAVDFNIACDRRKLQGQEKPDTDFFKCIAYRGIAEFIANYVKKGDGLAIVASTRKRSYKNKAGYDVWITEDVVNEITWFPKTKKAETVSEDHQGYAYPQTSTSKPVEYNMQGGTTETLVSGQGHMSDTDEELANTPNLDFDSDQLPFY